MTNEKLKAFVLNWFNNDGITEPTDEDVIQLYTDMTNDELDLGWYIERHTSASEEDATFVQTLVSDVFGIIIINHDVSVYFNNEQEVADYLAELNDAAAIMQAKLEAIQTLADFGDTYAYDVYTNDSEDDADGAKEREASAENIINAAALVTSVKK